MKVRAVFICFFFLLPTLFLLAPVIPVEAQGDGAAIERAAAQNFVPLVGIPYIEGNTVTTFGDYVNAFYFASISIAAFLAVVRIIFAGVKYMLSDIVTTKQAAKKDIRTALLGLLIVVGAVLILNTINTNLTTIKLFTDAPVPSIGGDYVPPTSTPTLSAGDSLRACSRFESIEACEIFCNENDGRIIRNGIMREGVLRYEDITLCHYRPDSPGDTPISPSITINEDLIYGLDEVNAIQRDLAAQDLLVFPIRQILRSERESEASLCRVRNGNPYFIEVSNNNPGIANPQHIVCIKNS